MRVGRQSICRPTPLFGEDPFPDRRPDVPGAIRCPAGFFGKALPTGPALADGPRRGNRPIRPSTMGRLQPTSGRKTDYCESMHLSDMQIPEPLTRMADGTIKQRNPFTGTEAWTVPGRADRPLPTAIPEPRPVTDAGRSAPNAFWKPLLRRPAYSTAERSGSACRLTISPTPGLSAASPTSSKSSPTTSGRRTTAIKYRVPSTNGWNAIWPIPPGAHTSSRFFA